MVCRHLQHFNTIVVDGVEEFLAASASWCQHHLCGSLQVFLVADVTYVSVLAVSLLHNSQLQLFGKFVELVAHLFYLL